MIVSTVHVFLSSSDGRGEKRPTFTAWSPPLASCSTRTSADSTGPSSGPWLGCTRRPTRACRSTCVHLPPCAEGCVACHPKKEVRHLSHVNTHAHAHTRRRTVTLYLYTLELRRSGPRRHLVFDFERSPADTLSPG